MAKGHSALMRIYYGSWGGWGLILVAWYASVAAFPCPEKAAKAPTRLSNVEWQLQTSSVPSHHASVDPASTTAIPSSTQTTSWDGCIGYPSILNHIDQRPLQQSGCAETRTEKDSQELSIMGFGGDLTLVNGSPFDWTLSGQHSYQMDTWKWPTVSAGTAERVYVEFRAKGLHTRDDAAEAYYNIDGTSNKFSVLARKPSSYELTISLDNVETEQSPHGSDIKLGFRHNAAVNWIMSTDEAGKFWSNSGTYTDWMQQSMGSLANRTLKHICMPGSHDAGMGTFSPDTSGGPFSGFAHIANTQTQYLDFYQQLMAGSRYFDLRPVLSKGEWVAGHYSTYTKNNKKIGLGGNGQSLKDIMRQINEFTAKYQELIIINLSHTMDTDNNYKALTQAQWNDLFTTLKTINNRYTVPNPGKTDFTNYRLGDFITDRASIFIFTELPSGIQLGVFANQGFYTSQNFPIYDSFSDSNNLQEMKKDQLTKLKKERNIVAKGSERREKFHIFSWTLTQQIEDVLLYEKAIMNMAASAFDDLISDAWNAFTPQSFPNVLYVDSLGVRDKSVVFPYDKVKSGLSVNTDITAFAIAVNNGRAGRNGVVTGK